MPGVSSTDQVVHEDLQASLKVLDVKNTPVMTRMKRGERPTNTLYSWTVEKMGKRQPGGVVEGQDVKAFEGDKTGRLYGRTERYQRKPHVTVEAEELNNAAKVDNEKEYNKQVRKKTIDSKRDMEYEILSDQESRDDDGLNPRKMRGLGAWINPGDGGTKSVAFTDTPTIPDAGYRTPRAQLYTGLKAAFTQAMLDTMMEERRKRTGAMSDFTLYCNTTLKNLINSDFGNYVANKSGFTVVAQRQSDQKLDNGRLIASGVDAYEGPYGVMTVELDPYIPYDARGYGLDFDQLRLRVLYLLRHSELENKGGGRRGLIDSIISVSPGDLRSHFKIAPSDEVAVDPDVD